MDVRRAGLESSKREKILIEFVPEQAKLDDEENKAVQLNHTTN